MYFNLKINRYLVFLCFSFILCVFCISVMSVTSLPTYTTKSSSVDIPIIMYHSILKDSKLHGKYVISPNDFEKDLIYLKENGYNTVVVKDLIDFVYNDKALPENPIMLTFDDGYYNNYLYVFPLLKKYNSQIVLSPVVTYTDLYSNSTDKGASYAHVTWDNLKEMKNSGYVEIQNHSYNLHCSNGTRLGAKQKKGEDYNTYRNALISDIEKAQNSFSTNLCYFPTTFVYPFGAISDSSDTIIKEMGFKSSIICESKINTITKDKNSLYSLGRFLRSNKTSARELLKK